MTRAKPEPLTLHSKSKTTAQVYRFVFKGYMSGWVIFTICDETGELSVQSDWGCWGHRWNTEHLGNGATLTEFIRDRDPEYADYLANKLSYSMPVNEREVADEKGTREAICSLILENRRAREIDEETARMAWDDVDSFMCEYSEVGPAHAYYVMPPTISDALGDDIYESCFKTVENRNLTVLRESLLPMLIRELKEEHEQQKG